MTRRKRIEIHKRALTLRQWKQAYAAELRSRWAALEPWQAGARHVVGQGASPVKDWQSAGPMSRRPSPDRPGGLSHPSSLPSPGRAPLDPGPATLDPSCTPLPIQPRRPLRGLPADHPFAGKVILVTIEACRRDGRLARAYVDWLMANANRWMEDGRCGLWHVWRCIELALGLSDSLHNLRNPLTNIPRCVTMTLQAAGRRLGGWPVRTGYSPGLTAWIAMWQRQLVTLQACAVADVVA